MANFVKSKENLSGVKIMQSFPRKAFEDLTQTLADAKLAARENLIVEKC
jgi:hypothetical protein